MLQHFPPHTRYVESFGGAAGVAHAMLGERHHVEEWQETASMLLIKLAAAPAEESALFASMSRPEIVVTEKWSRQRKSSPRPPAIPDPQ
ncbi:hypothetical protein [Pseudomonas prosekii]|uniref:hypothetical protein n=1 Tax=Pseudomonas prosekii TaxID=1148509 RepID=UPI00217E3558|nr:hypothetical protein [Pseudomonas prosekii]